MKESFLTSLFLQSVHRNRDKFFSQQFYCREKHIPCCREKETEEVAKKQRQKSKNEKEIEKSEKSVSHPPKGREKEKKNRK